jgi:hypothetical protein
LAQEALYKSGAVRSFQVVNSSEIALLLSDDWIAITEAAKLDYMASVQILPRFRALCGKPLLAPEIAASAADGAAADEAKYNQELKCSPPPARRLSASAFSTPSPPPPARDSASKTPFSAPGTLERRMRSVESAHLPSPMSGKSKSPTTALRATATTTTTLATTTTAAGCPMHRSASAPSIAHQKATSPRTVGRGPSSPRVPLADRTRYDAAFDIQSPNGEIFDLFITKVIPHHHKRSIAESELLALLFGNASSRCTSPTVLQYVQAPLTYHAKPLRTSVGDDGGGDSDGDGDGHRWYNNIGLLISTLTLIAFFQTTYQNGIATSKGFI